MEPEGTSLDQWLEKKVAWMVKETSQYFDTRELLMLCQTVATMRLNQTLERLCQAREQAPAGDTKAPAKKAAK
ncbi:MAG: hypothetical protein HY910_11575 [Desulfarculus sp.]|nr:hypothetical protein [Desulfarculus sp.]